MTHDELLAKIDNNLSNYCGDDCESCKINNVPWVALRAVVQLHEPDECNICDTCDSPLVYPCPTIQAIEKELE